MFLERVKVIEHKPDGTDVVVNEKTWSSAYGNAKWPEVFIRNSYKELVGQSIEVDISDATWQLDSPDGHYSWVATWEPYI